MSPPEIVNHHHHNQQQHLQLCSSPSSSSSSLSRVQRTQGRSMRTVRSTIFQTDHSCSFTANSVVSENLSESVIDFRLTELAKENPKKLSKFCADIEILEISQALSDFSACSSDISGELQRLASIPSAEDGGGATAAQPQPHHNGPESWLGFLEDETVSPDILDCISMESLTSAVKSCIEGLKSSSIDIKRSAAAKVRLLAKNRSENRALIGEYGAIPELIPLLRCTDPWTQEHAVTALFNLSLHEQNKGLIGESGAIKPLVHVLKTGTETSKQSAACALLSLSLVEENKSTIGVCGAIPPLVSLLMYGSNRGKKDALTTMYKLCSVKQNKERAVSAGAVKPLVGLVSEQGSGLEEKAMVVLSSLAGVREGRRAIAEEGGISVLVEAIEDGSVKGKEFAVFTLLQLCADSVRNRGLLVNEGGIPPLVSLSQSGTARAKHKAETLLRYLREPREGASSPPSSSSP
ncbi:hypothetical protein Sjap_002859 [Stephania japonica]|uniref:U-box domain-containing protein n=1 Tax=Stephania japonica TaxID=461633 RepID=A0AAP0PUX3_9MAGN